MKTLSVVVPCYNSAAYMAHCIDSILAGGDAIEIIIVDDGSKDETGVIGDRYAAQYPDRVKSLHQVNGGHGAAINTGLAAATGRFFKVVDSDDWLDQTALFALMVNLSNPDFTRNLDMLICNYIYDKVNAHHKNVVQFRHALPHDRMFNWQAVKLPVWKYLLMHTVIYRTSLLRAAHLHLPAHTFYEDNLYVFYPLPHVHNIRYLDLDLYHYYIGRADQSVNEQVMIGRIDQQLRVNKMMIDFYNATTFTDAALEHYMRGYVTVITGISSILLLRAGDAQSLQRKNDLWRYMRTQAPALYQRTHRGVVCRVVNIPGKMGRATTVGAYKMLRKVYQFN